MKILTIILLTLIKTFSFESYCNHQKECIAVKEKVGHLTEDYQTLKCLLTDKSRLTLNNSFEKIGGKNCEKINLNGIDKILLRPKDQGSIRLKKGMIDLEDLIGFERMLNFTVLIFEIQHFKGFELNLYDHWHNNDTELILDYLKQNGIMHFEYSTLDFYQKDRRLTTCKEFIEAANSTNPRSIFQIISKISSDAFFTLADNKNKLCPFAFKDFYMNHLYIIGENSFYSRKILSFTNDIIGGLNSTIIELELYVPNVDLSTDFLHPDVFKQLLRLHIISKVQKIHPDLFIWLNKVYIIWLKNDFIRTLMHNSGIEWIRNINEEFTCNLDNSTEVSDYIGRIKYILLECFNNPNSPPIIDVFPDEDFCLYKDFPVNQLVVILEYCTYKHQSGILNRKITCTYLWITRSYKYLVDFYDMGIIKASMDNLLNSSDYKSISNCNFEKMMELCNKSSFAAKNILTYFELGEVMKMAEIIINILSYILSIFGIVTNLLIIVTISSKKNREEFKTCKHYNYLRLNSICSCLILLIRFISWLNQCIYPFQVFCPLIRKTVFMQYFKIIVEEVLMTALKFMNNFTYIGFAFNRISLIGKDHNKLVKFMSDLGIKKYIGVTLLISIVLSVIKFFEFDINTGQHFESYPISYEYLNLINSDSHQNFTVYILNLISDSFNYFIFLIVNFAIDIGMIVKLRETLNEKLEKSKEYSSKVQQEKRSVENETAIDKTRSMIIWNISLNLILKLPAISYSIFHLYFIIFKSNPNNYMNYPRFSRFVMRICVEGKLCSVIFQFADFLYLFYISIQLFFYKHYDKKFSLSYDKIFHNKKSNIV